MVCILGSGGDEKQGEAEDKMKGLHGNLSFPAGKAGALGHGGRTMIFPRRLKPTARSYTDQ
jgi:hypothetical protein